MCLEQFDVSGLDDERIAYEVEQYLKGLPYVEDAHADWTSDTVMIEYDERHRTSEDMLDELEYSGCTPDERINSLVGRLKHRLAAI